MYGLRFTLDRVATAAASLVWLTSQQADARPSAAPAIPDAPAPSLMALPSPSSPPAPSRRPTEPRETGEESERRERAPKNSREREGERFDPRIRQNVLGRPIAPAWDAEKLINSDRPDFTDVLPVVGKGVWQTESGLSLKHRVGDDFKVDRWSAPETLLRLGVTPRFELRVRWDSYAYGAREGTAATSPGASYGSTFQLGFKWQAVPQTGWVPAHTFVGMLAYHAGTGRGPAFTGVQPGLNWCYGWQINKWMVLRGSTGFEVLVRVPQALKEGPDIVDVLPRQRQTTLELHQSAVTYLQLLPRLGMYYEWFALFTYGQERSVQHNGGVGAYVYITPDIQLDARFVGTLAGDWKETTVGVGVSFRGRYHPKKSTRALPR